MNRNVCIIIIALLSVFVIILAGNIIVIGDKLGQLTHVYVEYAFYGFILTFAIIYLIRPVMKVYRAPEFPILATNSTWNAKQLYAFAMQLSANCGYISDKKIRNEYQQKLQDDIRLHSADIEQLRLIISKEITLRMDGNREKNVIGINNRIIEWGQTVFMITAMSQNSKFDTIAVFMINCRLISDIVVASGFRPTKPQLFKLYVRVLTTALISYCTSKVFTDIDGVAPFDWSDDNDLSDMNANTDIDIDADGDIWGNMLEALKRVKIPGFAISSAINALMTLRIGYVTKAYLTEGPKALNGIANKRRIKYQAVKESFKAMPTVIANGNTVISKVIIDKLSPIFKG